MNNIIIFGMFLYINKDDVFSGKVQARHRFFYLNFERMTKLSSFVNYFSSMDNYFL